MVALNSNCSAVSCGTGSTQEQWLRADLAAHPATCTLAFWHQPRYTSGTSGATAAVQPLWQALADFGADVIVTGHVHNYERFAPQLPNGTLDQAGGIRQFIVGTGGKEHRGFGTVKPNSEVRNGNAFGVLELKLHPSGYDWNFVSEPGSAFTDSGTTACH